MDKPFFRLVGAPCGQHGQYTFYKALRLTGTREKILAIGDFFFVRIWQDSELVSIGELQLLWTDRVSDQTLVSLRLYFLPENTPDGRHQHGEDEVLAINDKVVVRAEDLLSWMSDGESWRWGLRAVWRGACAPPADPGSTQPLHHTKLDFSDVEREKNSIAVDVDSPGVMVFSYPRYCRYRALLSRLEGIQGDWLRDSLIAALGGYAAPTKNTRILYCKDTFEYPELEGHEFVCNHLAPRLKGRPRGRRRRARSRSHSPSSRSSDSDTRPHSPSPQQHHHQSPRRLSLRNGPERRSNDECKWQDTAEDKAFISQLKVFYKSKNEPFKGHTLKDLSLRALYNAVSARGGYEAVCRHRLWRNLSAEQPSRTRKHYERFLLPYENHERKNGINYKLNGKIDDTIPTIDVTDSPLRDDDYQDKLLRTPSPKIDKKNIDTKFDIIDSETGELKEEMNITDKPAEELNREFLDSIAKVEKPGKLNNKSIEEKSVEISSNTKPMPLDISQVPFNLASTPLNGHAGITNSTDQRLSRPAGRSSLRAVRVKPTRPHAQPSSTPPSLPTFRSDSASSSPPTSTSVNNFGIHHPPTSNHTSIHIAQTSTTHSDDEIVEVPYKPKTPEIIDLDEYPESPQAMKKKKLEILKERGLEVTALPPTNWATPMQPLLTPTPLIAPNPILLNPAVQHQIMAQAQLFQMYNIIPPNNGIQPPKVIQSTCIYGNSGPQKTVYGNPKDPFMPPPHVIQGVPVKPPRVPTVQTPAQDILDLTCKVQTPAVEIVRVPNAPTNLSKNYTLVDGKAVVGSNLEITLVNKVQNTKNRPPQKRSSNGKFVSTKAPTPPRSYSSPSPKKSSIVVPNYQIREELSPKEPKIDQKAMDPYMALYSSLAGQMDHRQLAIYRDLMANQFRNYGMMNLGTVPNTPTTK